MSNFKHRKVFKAMGLHKLRRNDVVCNKNGDGPWVPYGRVNRRIDDGHVEVIDTQRYMEIYADYELERIDYVGRWDDQYSDLRREYPIYIRMPTLRKLKQMAGRYNPTVWKRNRK